MKDKSIIQNPAIENTRWVEKNAFDELRNELDQRYKRLRTLIEDSEHQPIPSWKVRLAIEDISSIIDLLLDDNDTDNEVEITSPEA